MARSEAYRSYAGDELVTGEGVAVELPVAGLGVRVVSGLIDLVTGLLLLLAGAFLLTWLAERQSRAVGTTMGILLVAGVTIGVPASVETLTRGKTLGKLVMGLRTLRDDGGPIGFRHALARALIGFVEIYAFQGGPALVAAFLDSRSKRLGDMAAGTFVAFERAPLRLPPPPETPPPLAGWAASADMTSLPPGLAVAIRQFLGRAPTLNPDSRNEIAADLLASAMRQVSPPPPAGIHPEYVLAAVIAERRRRDTRRLAADEALRRRVIPRDDTQAPPGTHRPPLGTHRPPP